jgi:hypothetical protein
MGTELHFKMGSFYRIDDRTGFATRAESTRQEWTGLIVEKGRWEPRQPQDFVKGVVDDQTVPLPRPRSIDAYDGPLHTFITVQASIGDVLINVNNTSRMYAGDNIELVLDNGELLQTFIVQVASPTTLRLNNPLPWAASVNNDLTNLSAVSPPNQGINAFGQLE